jgi:hypothetical protein
LAGEPAGDGGVIGAGAGVGAGGQAPAQAERRGALIAPELVQQRGVVVRFDDHGDEGVVLGRGPDQCRSADVDVLDAVGELGAGRDRRLEGIEVDDHQIDGGDAVIRHRGQVALVVAERQDAAMHGRMQGLHPAVHHLGKARVLSHVAHRDAGLAQGRGGASGGENVDTETGEFTAELGEPGLVGDRYQRPTDGNQALIRGVRVDLGHGRSSSFGAGGTARVLAGPFVFRHQSPDQGQGFVAAARFGGRGEFIELRRQQLVIYEPRRR